MMTFLIPVTLTLVFAHWSEGAVHYGDRESVEHYFNQHPCQKNKDNNAYNKFVKKHILQGQFDRNSSNAWKKYLRQQKLCDRPRQSFIEKSDQDRVEQICSGSGRPVAKSSQGNLCISSSSLLVYEVKVNTNNSCEILSTKGRRTNVVVACDKIQKRCLPVHFERYRGQKADKKAKPCKL